MIHALVSVARTNERGTKCTDEQLAVAGYQSRYGRYNLAKGGIFEDHPTDKEQIIVSDGDTVIELQWHCIPNLKRTK